jgi:hypothetical protein
MDIFRFSVCSLRLFHLIQCPFILNASIVCYAVEPYLKTSFLKPRYGSETITLFHASCSGTCSAVLLISLVSIYIQPNCTENRTPVQHSGQF